MKVAYFAHAANLTGANRSLMDLLIALKRKGIVPIVFLPEDGPIVEELISHNIKYYFCPYKFWYTGLDSKKTIRKQIKYTFKVIYNSILAIKVVRLLKKEKIEIIHSNSLLIGFGAQTAEIARLPHVWHIREFMEEDHHLTFFNEKEAIKKMENATALVAISDVVADKYSKKLKRDVSIIYNGVDVNKYKIPDKEIFTKTEIKLMIVGRIVETKGQLEAIKAVELLGNRGYDLQLKIIGDGLGDGEVEKIQTYIDKQHLEDIVEYIPFQVDLSEYSRNCDIQLVCSHSEAFGRVTVEGMLSHSLVIGANAGCTPYLIKDGETGLLYTCGDEKSLANVIEWAINHKGESRIIADAGYNYAQKNFSIEKTANGVLNLYMGILN